MISLAKNQGVSLKKEVPTLNKVMLGLGWDPVGKKKGGLFSRLLGGGDSDGGNIDLDASCIMMDGLGRIVDSVWFRHLTSNDGSVKHGGDNLTGGGDGDDERIWVTLGDIPSNVHSLIFTVNSYRGQTFNEVDNAFVRLVDDVTDKEIARYSLTDSGNHTGMIMGSLVREGSDWKFTALGIKTNGRTHHDMARDFPVYLAAR